jgi:hypothetical protein
MTQPTNIVQPYTVTAGGPEQRAKLELDEERSSLLPGEYIHWLAHIPPGASLVRPFYSNDGGSMQLLGTDTLERSQAGLILDGTNRSVALDYYPEGTPTVVFFGKEIALNTSQLRSGIIVPQGNYDGKQVYKFNVYYQVKFYHIKHLPAHPPLISEADGGQPWEDYKGSGDLKSFPIEVRAWWE